MSQTSLLTPIDEQTFDGISQLIKASLPYMDKSSAKPMAIIARFIELRRTIDIFEQPAAIHACGIGTRRPSTEEMLHDLKKYCDGPHANMIDQLLKIMNMGKMYEKFKEMENNPMMQNLFRAMSSEFEKAASVSDCPDMTSEPEAAPQHKSSKSPKGGPSPMNFENMFKNLNPDMLKNINPDMLNQLPPDMMKNVDMNKFNKLLSAFTKPSDTPDPSIEREVEQIHQTLSGNPPFSADQLKSLLTPQQQKMFETFSQNMQSGK